MMSKRVYEEHTVFIIPKSLISGYRFRGLPPAMVLENGILDPFDGCSSDKGVGGELKAL